MSADRNAFDSFFCQQMTSEWIKGIVNYRPNSVFIAKASALRTPGNSIPVRSISSKCALSLVWCGREINQKCPVRMFSPHMCTFEEPNENKMIVFPLWQ